MLMTIESGPAAAAGLPANGVEHALYGAARDRARVGELLDELCRGRLWLPLPDGGEPVTDGHALPLPTVPSLGADFVPAFSYACARHTARRRPAHPASPLAPRYTC